MVDKTRHSDGGGTSNLETQIQAFIATSSKRIEDLEELQKKREIAVQRWESLVVDIHRREAFWQDVQSNMALAQEGTYLESGQSSVHRARRATSAQVTPSSEIGVTHPNSAPLIPAYTGVTDHGGYVTWPQFCVDICERYGQSKAINEVTEFNRLQQWADVDSFQKKFEDLRCHVLRARPHLDEAYFIECFVGGLKEELGPLVDVANPQTLLEAYKFAKRYERSLNASARQTLSKMPKPNPSQYLAKAQVPFSATRSSGNNFKVTSQKNLSIEALREQNLCFKCHDKYSPGHQCKPKALNTMEGEETFMEALDEELQNDAAGEGETEQAEVAINAMLVQNASSTAIRI
ncbi:hypothetical protein A4A49_59003 [Nicotiana attenuata]|uniref:Retrotransposon gag domain-containing protein n=1 Tax=Nicotiana attenuata TaxID=49451 RepID=A0A1J6KJY3_NICAT|nr:hypothetical protein A4A49_59003 [Nicotiana attenuata]